MALLAAIATGALVGLLVVLLGLVVLAAVLIAATANGRLEPADEDGAPEPYTAWVDAGTTQPEYDALFAAMTGCSIEKQHGFPKESA